MTPKHKEALRAAVDNITALYEKDAGRAALIISKLRDEAARGLKRVAIEGDAEQYDILQTRGPTLEFTGREIYTAEYVDRAGRSLALDAFVTLSGKLVIVSEVQERDGDAMVRAESFEADDTMAAMDWLGWSDKIGRAHV